MGQGAARYTEADREEYRRWLEHIPEGGTYEALWNLMRLQIKHDTAGLHMAIAEYEQFLQEGVAQQTMLTAMIPHIEQLIDAMQHEVNAVRTSLHAMKQGVVALLIGLTLVSIVLLLILWTR